MSKFIAGVIVFLGFVLAALLFVCMIYAGRYVLAFIWLVTWLIIGTWM